MKDRLKQIIDYYNLTARGFEKKIFVSEGVISKFLSSKNGIKADTFEKINAIFPEINLDWLITGRGDMLFDEEQKQNKNPPQPIDDRLILALANKISDLSREIGQLQAENDELKNKLARAEGKMAAYAKPVGG